MARKDGRKTRDQRPRRQGGPKAHPAGPGPGPGGRRRAPPRPARRGPKSCPMCGEVVADLAHHIRTRHDDPAAHPRD